MFLGDLFGREKSPKVDVLDAESFVEGMIAQISLITFPVKMPDFHILRGYLWRGRFQLLKIEGGQQAGGNARNLSGRKILICSEYQLGVRVTLEGLQGIKTDWLLR